MNDTYAYLKTNTTEKVILCSQIIDLPPHAKHDIASVNNLQ